MIQMKYPYKAGDSRYDGTIHKIEPFDLKRKTINGRELYVMRYKDLTLKNNDMITILEKRGAVFYKVPLESYGT